MTPVELVRLLDSGGDARAHFQATNGPWVDAFMDEIVAALRAPLTQHIIDQYGAVNCTCYGAADNQVQLNVKWTHDRGWEVYYGQTLADALDRMWAQKAMVASTKGE